MKRYIKFETSMVYDNYKAQILNTFDAKELVNILDNAVSDSKISNAEYAALYKLAIRQPAYPLGEDEYLRNAVDPDYLPGFEWEG